MNVEMAGVVFVAIVFWGFEVIVILLFEPEDVLGRSDFVDAEDADLDLVTVIIEVANNDSSAACCDDTKDTIAE